MKIQGIYKIRNCINGKVYVGQSIDIENRWKTHKRGITSNIKYYLYDSMKKHGIDNFEFLVIELVTDYMKLDEREQYWLDHYQSYNPDFGYNLVKQASSTIGYTHTEESKLKIKAARAKQVFTKETLFKKSEAMKKYRPTDETKRKIGVKHKGKKLSEEHKLKMIFFKKGHTPWNTGKFHSEETKQKISLAHTGKKLSDERKLKLLMANKGRIPWNKGKKHTEDSRLKISQTLKKRYNLRRKRLSIEDIQKLQQSNVIIFRKAN